MDDRITYELFKSRSTLPHGALFRIEFDNLTADEAGEMLALRIQFMAARDPKSSHRSRRCIADYLKTVPDGFNAKA